MATREVESLSDQLWMIRERNKLNKACGNGVTVIDQDQDKAAAEFLKMTDDLCNDKWMRSQQVYCVLPKDHPGMHESDAISDLGEDCRLWWNRGEELEDEQ